MAPEEDEADSDACHESGWPLEPSRVQNCGFFARLAVVNRAFFHACTDVIWQSMHDLTPFFGHVLQADRDEHGRPHLPMRYKKDAVTAKEWERFTFYSSKTKHLTLTPPNQPLMAHSWLSYLMNSTDRPKILFPNLRHGVLSSTDSVSLFVAFNVAPVLNAFEINLTRCSSQVEDAGVLTIGFAQNADALTCLRLIYPTTPPIVEDLSRIRSLKALHITVGYDVEKLNLPCLAALPCLETLHILQTIDPRDRVLAKRLPAHVNIQPLISQEATMLHLKRLRVRANGTTQYDVASSLLPKGLEELEIQVIPDVLNTQMLLIPLVGALYAHRNPYLRDLDISASDLSKSTSADIGELAPLRSDPRFDIGPFLDALSSLTSLTQLAIWEIPFLAVDIAPRLLRVAQNLPDLEYLVLMPADLSILPGDELMKLPLQSLESIAEHNPCLTVLQIALDITTNIPNQVKISSQGLQTLSVSTGVRDFEAFTTSQKFELARYFDSLFPLADMDDWVGDEPQEKFWDFIRDSLVFYRKGREAGSCP